MSSEQNFQRQNFLNDYNEDEFRKNLPSMSGEKLCEIIVCFRYLGLMKEESILAMEELASRRGSGDDFNYEEKIDELILNLPNINIDLDINKLLKSFKV